MDEKYAELLPEAPTLEEAGGEEFVLEHMMTARESALRYFKLLERDDWEVHTDKDGVLLRTLKIEGNPILMTNTSMEVNCNALDALKLYRDFGKQREALK